MMEVSSMVRATRNGRPASDDNHENFASVSATMTCGSKHDSPTMTVFLELVAYDS